jgi:hypothetical protein
LADQWKELWSKDVKGLPNSPTLNSRWCLEYNRKKELKQISDEYKKLHDVSDKTPLVRSSSKLMNYGANGGTSLLENQSQLFRMYTAQRVGESWASFNCTPTIPAIQVGIHWVDVCQVL